MFDPDRSFKPEDVGYMENKISDLSGGGKKCSCWDPLFSEILSKGLKTNREKNREIAIVE